MSIAFPRVSLARSLALVTMLAATPALASAQSPAAFKLTSPDVVANGNMTAKQVYNGFGCTGQNVSPALTWTSPPAGTMSYAVTVYDPDAPTGSGWWHWVIFNIPRRSPRCASQLIRKIPEFWISGRLDTLVCTS